MRRCVISSSRALHGANARKTVFLARGLQTGCKYQTVRRSLNRVAGFRAVTCLHGNGYRHMQRLKVLGNNVSARSLLATATAVCHATLKPFRNRIRYHCAYFQAPSIQYLPLYLCACLHPANRRYFCRGLSSALMLSTQRKDAVGGD